MRSYFLLFCLFFPLSYSFAADYFWIGGGGNWSDVNHWSATSGGASVGSIPSAIDNVIFDDNSGLTTIAQTVTMDIPVTVTDFDFSAVSSIFTLTSVLPSIEIQGSLTSNGIANITFFGAINFNATGPVSNITSNGTVWDNDINVNGTLPLSLQDALLTNGSITVNNGGFITGGADFTCLNFISNTTNVRTIDLSNSTATLPGINWTINSTNLIASVSNSTIQFSNMGTVFFTGGGLSYGIVISNSPVLQISSSNSFSQLFIANSSLLQLENGSTQQFEELSAFGDCANKTTINTIGSGPKAYLEKTGLPLFTSSSLSIENIDAVTGGGQQYQLSLSDTIAALNWEFIGTNYYWIGNSGNWSDPTHWSLSSGGFTAGCIPGPADNVIFDNNSFTIPAQTVNVDVVSTFGSMSWTNLTQNATLFLAQNLTARGDVNLSNLLTVTRNSYLVVFTFEAEASADLAAATFDCNLSVNMEDDLHSLQLTNDVVLTDSMGIYILSGGFNTNSFDITAGAFTVIELPSLDQKYVQWGASNIRLYSSFNASNVNSNFTFDAGTSKLKVGDPSKLNSLKSEGLIFNDVHLDFNTSNFDQVLSGNNTYNKFKIEKGSEITIDSTSIHTVLDSLILLGTCNDRIILKSSNASINATINKATTNDVIAECLDLESITSAGASQTALYSIDLGNNTNWSFGASAPVTSSFTVNGPYCLGDTTGFTNNSTAVNGNPLDITSYWYFDDGSTGYWYHSSPSDSSWISYESDTNQHVFISGGDFNVMLVTEFTNFCRDSLSIPVHINDPSIFLVSSDLDKTICAGQSVTFEASSYTAGAEFEFFLNGSSLNTPSINDTLYVTNTLAHLDTVSVVAYENGCVSDTMPKYVFTVHDLPVFSWSSNDPDTSICFGTPVTFNASSINPGYTYKFLINGIGQTAYITPGTYTNSTLNDGDLVQVVAKNSNGCTDTLEMNFEVISLPATTLTESNGGNVICAGSPVTFTGSGASTYEFFINGVSQGIPGGAIFTTSSLSTGQVVTVKGYSLEGCVKTAPEAISYTVNPLPSVNMTVSDSDTTICSDQSISFTASGASLYEFFINGISQGAPTATSTFTPPLGSLADNDVIHVNGSFSGCTSQSSTAIVTVINAPATVLTSSDVDQIICSEDLVSFSASGASNYQFYLNGTSQGAFSPNSIFNPGYLTNGSVIQVYGESNGCINSQSQTFTVLQSPSVNLFSSDLDNELCFGAPLTLTAVNATNYELFVDGLSQGPSQASGTFNPSLSAGSHQVFVIGTNPNGCSDTSATALNILINPIPNVVLNSSDIDNVICAGESVTFTGSGADQYLFYLDGLPLGSLSTTNNYTSSNLTDGQLVEVYGSSLGCNAYSNQIITNVVAIPNVSLSSSDIDNVFCEGTVVTFTASGANEFEFFVNGVSQGPLSTTDQINSSGWVSGSYAIEVIGDNGGCADNTSLNAIVNVLPIPSLNSSDLDNVICSGDPVSYSAGGGALYEFFVNGTSQGAQSPVNTYLTSNLLNGDVISTLVTGNTGCQSSINYPAITVNATPAATLISSEPDHEICIGDQIDFNAVGGGSYEFFINGNSQGSASSTNTFSTTNLSNGDIIDVEVILNGCPDLSPPFIITVHDYPVVGLFNNSDTTLCTGELTDLTAFGATNYQFSINGNPQGAFSTNSNFNQALSTGDVISVSGEQNGCTSSSNSTITYSVTPYPTLSNTIVPSTTICKDDVVSITSNGASNYLFELNGILLQNGSSNSITLEDLDNGDVLSITASNNDCFNAPQLTTFTVNQINLQLNLNPSAIICDGDNITATASGASLYQFYLNGNPFGSLTSNPVAIYSSLSSGDQITVSGSSNGCIQQLQNNFDIYVMDTPTITPGPNVQFCEGDSIVLYSNSNSSNNWIVDGSTVAGTTDSTLVMYTSGNVTLDNIAGGNGEAWSVGHNNYGVYGNNTQTDNTDPTIADVITGVETIVSGQHHILAIDGAGNLYSWGDNEFGQLGNGNFSDLLVPTLIGAVSNVRSAAAGDASTAVIDVSGNLYVWGKNNSGQLGLGNSSVVNFPVLNGALNDLDTLAAGLEHFIFLKNDGTVWTVGNNTYGQLGIGNTTNSQVPVQVLGLNSIIGVGAGDYNSFAINSSGEVYAWGNNVKGQLGLNDITNRLIPAVVNIDGIIQVDGGSEHTLMLDDQYRVYTIGSNSFGQLGNGLVSDTLLPCKLIDYQGITKISAGTYSSLLLRADQRVMGMGSNSQQQLGSISGTVITTPTVLNDIIGVTSISASDISSHFIFGTSTTCNSSVVSVNMLTNPTPSITSAGDLLISSSGTNYQWYFNGNPIPGANSQTYLVLSTGNYSVEVGYDNGCSAFSAIQFHGLASIIENDSNSITYFPNPVNEVLKIRFSQPIPSALVLTAIDQTGRIVLVETKTTIDSEVDVDISSVSPGVYTLILSSSEFTSSIKIIKK